MKKLHRPLLLTVFFIVFQELVSHPIVTIISTSCIDSVTEHISSKAGVLFDIDKVLMNYTNGDGQDYFGIACVEPGKTERVVRHALFNAQWVLALTAREFKKAHITEAQLNYLDLNFIGKFNGVIGWEEPSYVLHSKIKKKVESVVGLRNGILYSTGNYKSNALFELLRRLPKDQLPEEIVFIDDQWNNIDDLDKFFNGQVGTLKFQESSAFPQEHSTQMDVLSKVKKVTLLHYTAPTTTASYCDCYAWVNWISEKLSLRQ